MLYKAKTIVTYDGFTYNPGDTFNVADQDATAFGWDRENATVEQVSTPEATPEAPQAPEVPETTPAPEVTPSVESTEAPLGTTETGEYTPEPEAPQAPEGEGDINNA